MLALQTAINEIQQKLPFFGQKEIKQQCESLKESLTKSVPLTCTKPFQQLIVACISLGRTDLTETCINTILDWTRLGFLKGDTSVKPEGEDVNVLCSFIQQLEISSKVEKSSLQKSLISCIGEILMSPHCHVSGLWLRRVLQVMMNSFSYCKTGDEQDSAVSLMHRSVGSFFEYLKVDNVDYQQKDEKIPVSLQSCINVLDQLCYFGTEGKVPAFVQTLTSPISLITAQNLITKQENEKDSTSGNETSGKQSDKDASIQTIPLLALSCINHLIGRYGTLIMKHKQIVRFLCERLLPAMVGACGLQSLLVFRYVTRIVFMLIKLIFFNRRIAEEYNMFHNQQINSSESNITENQSEQIQPSFSYTLLKSGISSLLTIYTYILQTHGANESSIEEKKQKQEIQGEGIEPKEIEVIKDENEEIKDEHTKKVTEQVQNDEQISKEEWQLKRQKKENDKLQHRSEEIEEYYQIWSKLSPLESISSQVLLLPQSLALNLPIKKEQNTNEIPEQLNQQIAQNASNTNIQSNKLIAPQMPIADITETHIEQGIVSPSLITQALHCINQVSITSCVLHSLIRLGMKYTIPYKDELAPLLIVHLDHPARQIRLLASLLLNMHVSYTSTTTNPIKGSAQQAFSGSGLFAACPIEIRDEDFNPSLYAKEEDV